MSFNDNACIVPHVHGYALEKRFLTPLLNVVLLLYILEIYIDCIYFTEKNKKNNKKNTNIYHQLGSLKTSDWWEEKTKKNTNEPYLQYVTSPWSDIFENSWLLMFNCCVPRLPTTNWIIFPWVSRYGFWSHKSIAEANEKKKNTHKHKNILLLKYTDFYEQFKFKKKTNQLMMLMVRIEYFFSSYKIQRTFNTLILFELILNDALQFLWKLFNSTLLFKEQ